MKYYLDHNIYIYSLNDNLIGDAVETLKSKGVKFLYSPAHIEETYTAFRKNNNYLETKDKIFNQISKFTNNYELLPTEISGIVIMQEDPKVCWVRVLTNDTTNQVEANGKTIHQQYKISHKELFNQDKHFRSISGLSYDKIWKNSLIVESFQNFNKKIPSIIEFHNYSSISLFLEQGVDKFIPTDLKIHEGMYDELEKSHKILEFVIELLFIFLSLVGYNSDKKESKAISGIHDVSHAIYGTKVDKLFSCDKKFVNKCAAVYYYLGVKTQVILCQKNDIAKTLLNS